MLTLDERQALAAAVRAARAASASIFAPSAAQNGLTRLTVAQWADESGWGSHQPGNNPFGIKAVSGQAYTRKVTSEFANGVQQQLEQDFAAYPDLSGAFAAHANLITTGKYFAPAWQKFCEDEDFPAFVGAVATHYATYPEYAPLILRICQMPEVQATLAAPAVP